MGLQAGIQLKLSKKYQKTQNKAAPSGFLAWTHSPAPTFSLSLSLSPSLLAIDNLYSKLKLNDTARYSQ